MKIGIIGFGAIGFDVAKKLDKELDLLNSDILKFVRVLDSISDPRGRILVLGVE